jgi:hypothetical protein
MVFTVNIDDWFFPGRHKCPKGKPVDPGIKGQALASDPALVIST